MKTLSSVCELGPWISSENGTSSNSVLSCGLALEKNWDGVPCGSGTVTNHYRRSWAIRAPKLSKWLLNGITGIQAKHKG